MSVDIWITKLNNKMSTLHKYIQHLWKIFEYTSLVVLNTSSYLTPKISYYVFAWPWNCKQKCIQIIHSFLFYLLMKVNSICYSKFLKKKIYRISSKEIKVVGEYWINQDMCYLLVTITFLVCFESFSRMKILKMLLFLNKWRDV